VRWVSSTQPVSWTEAAVGEANWVGPERFELSTNGLKVSFKLSAPVYSRSLLFTFLALLYMPVRHCTPLFMGVGINVGITLARLARSHIAECHYRPDDSPGVLLAIGPLLRCLVTR